MSGPLALPASAHHVKWEIREGDAWELAGQLPAGSVDAIVTSPPYWGLRSYGLEHNQEILKVWTQSGEDALVAPPYSWYAQQGGVLGLEPYPSWFVAHLVEIFDRLAPAVADDGSVWVNLGDTYFGRWSSIRDDGRQGLSGSARSRRVTPSGGVLHDKQLLLIPARFALAMQESGWILRNDVIWHKPNVPPRPERDRLRLSHEHLFHFVKRRRARRPTYFYDLNEVEPGALDVIAASGASDGHSATFPLDLIRPRVRSSSREGGMVLDPFCGTGTTLVAALTERRNALGFELSATFASTARFRLNAIEDGIKRDE